MKDFDEYKNKLPYPVKADYTTVYGYSKGKLVFEIPLYDFDPESEEAQKATAIEKDVDHDGLKAAQNAYGEETSRLMNEFRKDVYDDCGLTDNPKRDKVFSLAWDYGHSSGLSEVYSHVCEFADLVMD